jgi:hypothetical protein
MREKTVLSIVAAIFAVGLVPAEAYGQVAIPAAIARAKQTGLPMLVIGVTDTCPHCVRLRQRLQTEPDLRELLAQYVPVEIEAGTADWNLWTQQFPPGGNGVPLIYIVSAEGKEIYNKSGAPQGDGLKELLSTGIEQTGGPKQLGPQREAMVAAARKIEMLAQRGKKAEAIAAAAPYAAAAADHEKLGPIVETWNQEAAEKLQKAQSMLASADEAFSGVLTVVTVQRVYGPLPGVKEQVEELLETIQQTPDQQEMMELAKAIDKGRALEDRENVRGAMAAYKAVAARHPDTPAAAWAENRLQELSPQSAATADRPAETKSEPAPVEVADSKRAASYLRMAATFSKTRPDKAREYAQKVLDAMPPDSQESQRAQELINQLPE